MMVFDINSRGIYPCNVLSNLYNNSFYLKGGIYIHSMEGFLQGLKVEDVVKQNEIFGMDGLQAKKLSSSLKTKQNVLYFQGRPFNRHSEFYSTLLKEAYLAMLFHNSNYRDALKATAGCILDHSIGKDNPEETILTKKEFLDILNYLRDCLLGAD